MGIGLESSLGYKSKRDLVVDLVREAISRGDITPGQRLRQEELAQKLGISPTPVREALRRLEAEGILVHIPHKGVKVAEINVDDAQEIYLIRGILESQITRIAVPHLSVNDLRKLEKLQKQMEETLAAGRLKPLRKMNGEFHMTLYRAANTRRLYPLITGLWTQYPGDTLWVIPQRAQRSVDEHRRILTAVQSEDAELAGELIKQHIESAARSVIEFIQQNTASSSK